MEGISYTNAELQKAYELAENAHSGQYRDCGEPFVRHPVRVVEVLKKNDIEDIITLCSGMGA